MGKEYQQLRLKDFIQFNPKEKLAKGSIARKITMEHIVPYNRYVYSNTFEEYKGGSKFRNGDTIMARITPCLENGKTAYVSSLDQNELAFGSTEFIVLREISDVSDKKYIYYLISTPEIRNIAIKSMVGSSGRQRVQQNVLENYIVCLPSLKEQRRIANILSSLDDKIELNRRINENLEQQAQALFKAWFVDFEPFKDGKFVDSELGMIPEGWKVGNFEEFVEVKYGKDHKKLASGTIPVYGSGGIMRYVDRYLYNKESVLIPRKGSLNNVMYVNHPFWTVDTMFYTHMKIEGIAKFIYLLISPKDLLSMNSGSAVPSMTVDILNKIAIIIPPTTILQQFESIVKPFFIMAESLQKENQRLAHLRDTLLPKLMSGELKINDLSI